MLHSNFFALRCANRVGHERMKSEYGNFQDPLGLLQRMLLSKDRAARSALYRAASGMMLQPLDLLLEYFERKKLQEAKFSNLPMLFIVGAPRSGTTLFYQTLARFLPVAYFTNWSALFPRAPITATLAAKRFLSAKHFNDRSFYGNVAGLAVPNDGFQVWNRWLGTDRYRAQQQISEAAKREMRVFFNAWCAALQLPFLNKNNRNTDCVALLASIFSNAYFIEVRRHPVYVAQSLLLARLRIQGSKEIGWGLRSSSGTPGKNYIDAVCEQIFEIEMKLRVDKIKVQPQRYIEISYEAFCANPVAFVQRIGQEILNQASDAAVLRRRLQPFVVTNTPRLAPEEYEKIRARIGELYEADRLAEFEIASRAAA